jgi:sugar phosphate isomerase/epimerase
MRFSACNEIFGARPWEDVCAWAAAAGFDGLEVASIAFAPSVRDIPKARRAAIRRAAQDRGLAISALHMILSPPSMGLHINSPDAAVRQRTVEYLKAVFDFCADVGSPRMVYGSPFTRNVHETLSWTEARALMKESLLGCLDEAEDRGLVLCIEPLPADCTDLFTTVEAALAFVEDVGHPALGLMADTKAMSTEARPVAKTVRLFGRYLRHVHANDSSGRAPGFGGLDFAPIMQALKEVGYDGWVSLEPFAYKPDPESVAALSLKYLKACLEAGAATP